MKSIYHILIVDDHPFFIDGIINALAPFPEFKVTQTLQNGNDVLNQLANTRPDIIILDINLPGKTGLELLPLVKQQYPGIKIMLLSMYVPADVQLSPDNRFIDAYVLKNSGTEILVNALYAILKGNQFWDPLIKKNSLHGSDRFSQQLKLSSREKDIIQLLKEGLTSKKIAEKLFISELTVKTHRKNIMKKLEVKNIAELLLKI